MANAKLGRKLNLTTKTGIEVKDHSSDPIKKAFDDVYRSGIGMIVEVKKNGVTYIGEVTGATAKRGCAGCVTFIVQTMDSKESLNVSWRDQGLESFRKLGLKDLAPLFQQRG
jgi:hypothetical protein